MSGPSSTETVVDPRSPAKAFVHRVSRRTSADVGAWAVALVIATVLVTDEVAWRPLLTAVLLASVVQVIAGVATGLYRRHARYGSFEEAPLLTVTFLVVTLVVTLVGQGGDLPASAVLLAGPLALCGSLVPRYAWQQLSQGRRRPGPAAEPIVVVGAGFAGELIVRGLQGDLEAVYRPVAMLDDDPAKAHLRIAGVRVEGRLQDLVAVAARHRVRHVLVAIPSASAELVQRVASLADEAGIRVSVLPHTAELVGRTPTAADIRLVDERDLLGRHHVETDIDAVAGYVTGATVLVTGAGGSIGSELCRQIHRLGPSKLVMLDRDESGLHAVQLDLHGAALLEDPNLVVADIRDRDRLFEVFAEHRPDVVFHAAALKHLPLLELHPGEAVKTNVAGTANVLDAALSVDTRTFVNISTDKAADPTSVLGASKRVAERITAHVAQEHGVRYLSVRFGNVLGSRGSVLTAFRAQIAAGGPVTVTHPDVTRYFMTVQEAVQLVVQAGAIGDGGEVLVLDMGTPVRIDDVARRLIALSGKQVDVVYTGLRPGEKLHEVLCAGDEVGVARRHPLISHVAVEPLATVSVPWEGSPHVKQDLFAACVGAGASDRLLS